MRARQVLTQRGVEAAKPQAKRYARPDGTVPGLRLIVHPGGAKVFSLATRVNGRPINVKIGDVPTLTLAEARKLARDKLREIAAGNDPRQIEREAKRAEAETVAAVTERFIERHVRVNNRTAGEIERKLRAEVLPRWGSRPLASITRRDVIALLDAIADRGARIQANRTLSTIRKLFSWAIDRDLIEHSPAERIKRPSAEIKRDRTLSDSELVLVWRAAGQLAYPFGPFYRVLILTGQRREEVGGMRWSEIAPDAPIWTLPRARTKNNVAHTVPLSPAVQGILAGLPRIDDCHFVFTSNGRTSIGGYSKAKRALDVAMARPIDPWVVHDIRRTMATSMARLGVTLPVVEKILNHTGGSFGGVQGIYQRHDFAAEKARALDLWAEHVLGLDGVDNVVV